MPLAYILRRVSSECGLGNYTTNTQQKARALDLINIACEAIWEETDLPGSCDEVLINVLADSEMALPTYFGEIRAMREKSLMHKWTLNDMRPRYQNEPWKQLWRNWRHKGYSAIQGAIVNAAPLVLSVATPDNSIVVVTGSTAVANRVTDTFTFTAGGSQTVEGSQSFTFIESIIKITGSNLYDITVSDINGQVLAVVYNNEVETRYIVMDVSQYPFGGETSTGERVMEVLFKKKLKLLAADTDTFPVPGWDNIIVDRTIQAFNESKEGSEQRAMLYATKVEKQSAQKIKHQEGGIEKEIQFAENPMYALTKRPYSRIWRG